MRRISVFIVMTMVVVFAFTSVAWAGPAIYRDLQQSQFPIGDKSVPMVHHDKKPSGGGHHGGGHSGGGHVDKHHSGVHHGGIHHGGVHHGGVHHGGVHHDGHRYHHWDRRGWPHDRPWGRYFHDWEWFVGFGIIGLGAYYLAENANEVVYVHFETENRAYFKEVTRRYGNYIYRERVAGFGGEGWRYYWINAQNVVCVFVRDDGYTHSFIWNRADAGSQAITLGLLTEEQLAVYGEYDANMPAALAAEYINVVMWGQTEWQ